MMEQCINGSSAVWPKCLSEIETIESIKQGMSLSRFGDGELVCAEGNGYVSQEPDIQLAGELQSILRKPKIDCLVGIPTMLGPRADWWKGKQARFMRYLNLDVIYGSSFIGIPCLAPHIDTEEYKESVRSLYRDKAVIAVCHDQHPLSKILSKEAAYVVRVDCPAKNAYSEIDEIERSCLSMDADIVMMSCGPTATCLASRLSDLIQAVDFGRCARLVD